MNIVCSKENLHSGIQIVSKAVPNRTTMSILECILLETDGSQVKLTANDMEIGIETKIDAQVIKEGKIALDAKLLAEIVRKLPDNDVTIEVKNDFITVITCEKAIFTIIGKSGSDFSSLPEVEKIDSIMISQLTLKEIIRQTIFSIGHDINNILMTGELFEITGDVLKVYSLDTHRISIRKVYLKNSYPNRKEVIPGKTLNEIMKILPGDADKDVTIFFTGKHVIFEFDNTMVISRLLEGEFFRTDQLLSRDYSTKISINKKVLQNCIDRAMLLIKEEDKKPIIMSISDEVMELKINSVIGSMNEDIEIEKQGQDLMIGFNPKYFIDALKVIDDEMVDIYMINPKSPCFIRDNDNNYVYVLMPVNFITVDGA
ncbi:MAG: DNA polymerase III subunit beta [Lachnospiraceae bacterium]|jgi:DNA polymerase-3 subunit beta|nr:DNA polymerase III subunit beta [Lachnospiraceae bacterium]